MCKKWVTLAFMVAVATAVSAQGFVDVPSREKLFGIGEPEEYKKAVGKTYTLMFGRANCAQLVPIKSTPKRDERRLYQSEVPQSFTVNKVINDRTPRYYNDPEMEVTMQDGSVGYLNWHPFSLYSGRIDNDYDLKRKCILGGTSEEVNALLLDDAQNLATRQAEITKRQEEEARESAERAKRPAPRIGMSTKDVIKRTSWGAPDRANRTIVGNVVSEQWVYEGGFYLYFRNDKLTAIQQQH
jgi:hypothetical protein